MAREYGTRRSSRSRRGAPHQVLVSVVIFLFGYITASFFDFATLTHWVNSQVLAHHELKKEPVKRTTQAAIPPKPKFEFYTLLANEKVPGSQPAAHLEAATQSVSTPSATTALTSSTKAPSISSSSNRTPSTHEVAVSSTATPPIKPNAPIVNKPGETKATAASVGKGNYLVQVASFKARQDAEYMKGSLILKGFNVYIIPVSHATKGNWFRVVVGPYANRMLAQKAQVTLAKNERLHGMITAGG